MDAEKSDSNPFSFKTFLKRGEGPPPPASASKGTAKKGSGKKKGPGKKSQSDVPFPDSDDIGARKSDSENPFSFAKFVERKSTKQTTTSLFNSSSSEDEDNSSLTTVAQPPLPPPAPSSPHTSAKPPLPKTSRAGKPPSSPSRTKKKDSTGKKPRKQRNEISIFDTSDNSDTETNAITGAIRPNSVSLGSRNGVLRNRSGSKSSLSGTSPSSGSSPEIAKRGLGVGLGGGISLGEMVSGVLDSGFGEAAEMKKLKVENERLQRELQQSQEDLKKQCDKNDSLKLKIKAMKKKEAEDTKALEDVVQKVESNLVTTTKRAVSAEASIVKLKKELTSLQAQLAQSTPQAVHQHYEEILRGVREKSTYASQQLVAASAMADKNIREMLTGVEALKNVAEMLQFVDRISEVRTSTSNDSAST